MPSPARLLRLALLLPALAFPLSAARAQVYTFDSGTEGWAVFDINGSGFLGANPFPSTAVPSLDATVGLPPGSLRIVDFVADTWIGAPTSIQGDHSADYGTTFEFDIMYRTRDETVYAAVAIAGTAQTLYIFLPPPTLNTWLHWTFPLNAGPWQVNAPGGPIATQAEVQAVLANLRGVFIHTEWRTGPDNTNVDNIAFGFQTAACNLSDITEVGGTSESPGSPDDQLTVDDIIVFVNLFSDGSGCPGAAPCSRADICGVGGPPEAPDGQLTVDDIIAFFNAFSDGC